MIHIPQELCVLPALILNECMIIAMCIESEFRTQPTIQTAQRVELQDYDMLFSFTHGMFHCFVLYASCGGESYELALNLVPITSEQYPGAFSKVIRLRDKDPLAELKDLLQIIRTKELERLAAGDIQIMR
jgi:hypothetical protein